MWSSVTITFTPQWEGTQRSRLKNSVIRSFNVTKSKSLTAAINNCEWMNKGQPLPERSYKRLSRTPLKVNNSIKRAEYKAIRYISRQQTGWPHLAISTGRNKLLWIRFLRGDWQGKCSVLSTKHVLHVLTTCSTRWAKAKRCNQSLQQTRSSRVALRTDVWSCTQLSTEHKCGLVHTPALNRSLVLCTPQHWTQV